MTTRFSSFFFCFFFFFLFFFCFLFFCFLLFFFFCFFFDAVIRANTVFNLVSSTSILGLWGTYVAAAVFMFGLFVVLLLCLKGSVWHCDRLVGEHYENITKHYETFFFHISAQNRLRTLVRTASPRWF